MFPQFRFIQVAYNKQIPGFTKSTAKGPQSSGKFANGSLKLVATLECTDRLVAQIDAVTNRRAGHVDAIGRRGAGHVDAYRSSICITGGRYGACIGIGASHQRRQRRGSRSWNGGGFTFTGGVLQCGDASSTCFAGGSNGA